MKRNDFIKFSGMTFAGISSGIIDPFSLAKKGVNYDSLCFDNELKRLIIIDKNDEMWVGWLARLVVSSLVSSLAAKVVDRWTGDCQCNGTSCSANNASSSNYSNTNGVYGYDSPNQRFLTQEINAGTGGSGFTNMSVPFLNRYNSKVTNVEGPFLAGLCFATEDLTSRYDKDLVRSIIVPKYELSSGGYRFDTNPCYPTKFKTDFGTTEVAYTPKYGGGSIEVSARNEYDTLKWGKTYDFRV